MISKLNTPVCQQAGKGMIKRLCELSVNSFLRSLREI